jgi:hypothetical protein
MKADAEDKHSDLEAAFEQSLFVHDRPLWQKVYDPEPEDIEEDVEWVTRDDPSAFRSMMDELRGMGVLEDER